MTWLAPWAFVGLVAVAAPVLVHWLARQRAERLRFPTLEFLVRTPPVSVHRHRLRDLPLLLVRIGIVVAAVTAMAQPAWVWPGASASGPAKAIVVDTSASMLRTLGDGRAGVEVARETAAAYSGESGGDSGGRSSIVIPAAGLSDGVGKAAAWLAAQDAPRELIVVSDFQLGALVLSDLAEVPDDAGVRLVPVPVRGAVPVAPTPPRARLRVWVGAAEAEAAAAAEAAARATVDVGNELVADVPLISDQLISIVFPSAPDYAALQAAARPIDTPELFALAADIQRELGHALVADCRAISHERMSGLAVFSDAEPGSLLSAMLMAAILRASGPPAPSAAEREPDTLAAATLEAWQRDTDATQAPVRSGGSSGGRWFWGLALLLFALEGWMRRQPASESTEVAHADAA